MIGVVLTEGAKMSPIGWVLIIGLIVVIVWAVWYDKKRSGKFDEEIDKLFADNKVYGNDTIFITKDNELVVRYHYQAVSGYKIFKLEDVKYIMSCWDHSSKCWILNLYNEKKKAVVGEDHKSTKRKPLKATAHFSTRNENVEFIEMLLQFAPTAQLVGMYFKEYKGDYKKQ